MDSKRIYRKTPLGEEALKDRSQLKSGRLRAALILVDGHASVAELLLKLGRKGRSDDRLAHLERLGFIEAAPAPSPKPRRSKGSKSRAASAPPAGAAEVPAAATLGTPQAALETLSQVVASATEETIAEPRPSAALPLPVSVEAAAEPQAPPEPAGEAVPDPAPAPPSVSPSEPEPGAVAEPELAAQPVPAAEPPAETGESEPETAARAPQQAAPPAAAAPARVSPSVPATAAAPVEPSTPDVATQPPPEAAAAAAPATIEMGSEASVPVAMAADAQPAIVLPVDDLQEPVPPEEAERTPPPERPPSWLSIRLTRRRAARAAARSAARAKPERSSRRTILILLPLVLVGLALAAVVALRHNDLRHGIEQKVSAHFGRPVRIEKVGIALLPHPGLRLEGVASADGRTARAAEVVISPSIHAIQDLLRPRFDLHVSGLALEREAIGALCALAGVDAATALASQIDTVTITGLSLALPRAVLDGLRGEISLDPARGTPEVVVGDADRHLRVELSPAPRGCRFSVSGGGWRPPLVAIPVLDGVTAKGTVDDKSLRLESFDARSSEGLVVGSGSLSWEPRAALDLRLELQHLSLARLLASLGMPAAARGELDAKLRVSASAPALGQLAAALGGSGPVTVSRGSIERLDLMEAARSSGSSRVHGGALDFEQLSANFLLEGDTASLRNLRLSAGALSADGNLSVKRDAALRGNLNVQLQSPGGQIRVPLRVAGNLAAPELSSVRDAPATTETPRSAEPAPQEQ